MVLNSYVGRLQVSLETCSSEWACKLIENCPPVLVLACYLSHMTGKQINHAAITDET